MDLINATSMEAGYTMGTEPSAREHLVVAVKGTFTIPASPELPPALADEQVPLVMADEFTGEPGFSAPTVEADFPLRKPLCDVLLNGSAYAPGGQPVTRLEVRLRVGQLAKSFTVVGDREWQASGAAIRVGPPRPFTVMDISYDRAFGGIDDFHPDEKRKRTYHPNPAGRGYHENMSADLIDGTPLPNTEETGRNVSIPNGGYRPMSFGPVGRGWDPRYRLGGTYDQDWIDNVFPFLPADFQDAYYQAAPPDQQIEHPRGGELVVLTNLTPEGRTAFNLPSVDVPVVFFLRGGGREERRGVLDTILIEPDKGRFMLTWRASLPLKRNMFEIVQVLAGHKSRAWWRARDLGKTYYPSLGALARSNQGEDADEAEPVA